MTDELTKILDDLQRRVTEGAEDIRRYLASPEGRVLRQRIAQILIFTAPFVFRFGRFKASRMGKVLGVLGGTAVVVKLAEVLRDWEPGETRRDDVRAGGA